MDDYHTTDLASRLFLDVSVKTDKIIREKLFSSENALTDQKPERVGGVRELAPYLLGGIHKFLD